MCEINVAYSMASLQTADCFVLSIHEYCGPLDWYLTTPNYKRPYTQHLETKVQHAMCLDAASQSALPGSERHASLALKELLQRSQTVLQLPDTSVQD